MRRPSRGFSLLEVLLAIAIVGGGIISLLLIRSNAIQMAAESIRLRSTRLLAADQAGHALAVGLSTTLLPRDPGEGFEGYRVERVVEEVAFEELLPDELVERPRSEDDGPGAPGSGEAGGTGSAGGEGGSGLLMRRLVVVVYPPGAEDDPELAVTLVTYQLDEPEEKPGGSGTQGEGAEGAGGFPEQLPPLVGPNAVGPPGAGTGDGTGSGEEPKDPDNPNPGGGGG